MGEAEEKNGKGMASLVRNLGQVLVILALTIYIVVDKTSASNKPNGLDERIARLEECVISLRPLPSEFAGIKATLTSLDRQVDKIEKKIDEYIRIK